MFPALYKRFCICYPVRSAILLVIVLLCIAKPAYCFSEGRIDSLLKLSNSSIAEKRISALLELSSYYGTFNEFKSFNYASEALLLSKKEGLHLQEIKAHNLLADGFVNLSKLDSAKFHYLVAINTSKKESLTVGLLLSYVHISSFYSGIGLNDSAFYFLNEAKKITNDKGSPKVLALLNEALGDYFNLQKVYSIAVEYYNNSLRLLREINSDHINDVLFKIANTYFENNDYHKALECYSEGYNISLNNKDIQATGLSLFGQGRVYAIEKQDQKAKELYEKAIICFAKAEDKFDISKTRLNLALLAYNQKSYKEAIENGLLTIANSRNNRDKNTVYAAYDLLAKAYMENGNYKEAYESEKIRGQYGDSIHNSELMGKMAGIKIRYENTQKEAENSGLKAIKYRQLSQLEKQTNLKWYILVILFFSIVITLVVYVGNNGKKKNLERLQSQKLLIGDKHEALAAINAEILNQQQQLEATNNFKNKLFSIVSHDFRSPLLSLKSFLFLLEDSELTHEEMRIMTKDITERVNVTSDFLENLLNWSQSQLQGFKSYKRLVDVHIVTEELFYLFKSHAESKGITLINNVPYNTEILADANTIKLVMRNLITNAIKFTSKGHVKVSAAINDEIIISVEDTGIGLTELEKERLFTGNNSSSLGTANEKGSGLGLMLCKEFVEGNGGTIWLKTEVGKGSTFYFRLPLIKETE